MSAFFINRPIFAWVIAILIMLAGALSIIRLPVSHYPDVAAPAINITGIYPGASAQSVQDSVVQVIEQQMNGMDGFRYISSQSSSDGSFSVTVTFAQGTNPDIAQVQVQNKLQLAMPMLPSVVQAQGVSVAKYQTNIMLIVNLYSERPEHDSAFLGDYLLSHVKDPVSRTEGVGQITSWASQYAMRIWLKPERLQSYQLIPADVIRAVENQNVQISSGQLGGLPALDGVQLNAIVISKTKMTTVEEFENILLKVNVDGSQVRLRDVAAISLDSENASITTEFNGFPAGAIAIRLAPGANILDTTRAIKQTVAELEPFFPDGVKAAYTTETAPTVEASIMAVISTLLEAIGLIFLIMLLFLQNVRATLIATLAIPVAILGTFAVLLAFGFEINVMTMFAMVLAIGLLVDDAIVVVENVERVMLEENLSPKDATRKSLKQIQGALVGIGLVISAAFLPMAFFDGSTGIIYRQFSITIIAAMSLSVLIALIFTPALCATLLKPGAHDQGSKGISGWFNRAFDAITKKYGSTVGVILARKRLAAVAAMAVFGLTAVLFLQLPTGFLPNEDQNRLFVVVQLPPNATAERTRNVTREASDYLLKNAPGIVKDVLSVTGYNPGGVGQNQGILFVDLKPHAQRTGEIQTVFQLADIARKGFANIPDARIMALTPPPIPELGSFTGFDFYLQDRGGVGYAALAEARDHFIRLAANDEALAMVRPNTLVEQQQFSMLIDEEKARSLGVSLDDVNSTMSIAWGSAYINDFVHNGRLKKVYAQSEASARTAPDDFDKWHIRNQSGEMVTFAAFAEGRWGNAAPALSRYNGVPAIEILGQGAAGVASGSAMERVEELAKELPPGIGISFTALSFEERLSGNQTIYLYAISLVVIFLCLAALYESWSIPFAVMLVIPLGVLGAVALNMFRGYANDVFFQVGILTIIGLSAKNAILIIEFAKTLYEREGYSLIEATTRAAQMRLRPILMTSLAFVFGVIPMALASGAASASQNALGTAVVGGTLTATFLGIFFVPLFFVLVTGLFPRKNLEDGDNS